MSDITGRCLCGATTYRAEGPAKFSIVCYCTDCQRATGTGHAPALGVTREGFELDGPVKSYARQADSGSDLAFNFCGECGSPMTKLTTKAPSTVFVYAGSLDNPQDFPDPMPVFEESRLPWDG